MRCCAPVAKTEALEPQAEQSDEPHDDQINRHDAVEQFREYQNENARDQGDEWDECNREGHGLLRALLVIDHSNNDQMVEKEVRWPR
jgi:hypothetical protein